MVNQIKQEIIQKNKEQKAKIATLNFVHKSSCDSIADDSPANK